ncbi:MAG: IS200/IS605 family element transposase accessory protein TnpB [Okeania sp. SIO2D1]|nr:IS200/IS605 family element transposase accessory protein TnpB [Okeania sp. SIO2D1]
MRNIVCQVVKLAKFFECAIAIESLDFTKKKSKMSSDSKVYNEMLILLSTGMFREAILSRCTRFGVELIKVNPAFTSVIGMINYMGKYGLNSGTAAALVIGRRALKLSEKIPQCLLRPEDFNKYDWSHWRRVASFIKLNRIRRTQLFQWRKTRLRYPQQLLTSDFIKGRAIPPGNGKIFLEVCSNTRCKNNF